jgi:hypothetical protein
MQSLRRQEYTTVKKGKRIPSISAKEKVTGTEGFD